MEVSNPRPLLPPRDERHQRVAAVVCSEEAVVLLRESGWVYLMGTSPVWHPQCPGSPPVLPHPLGPTCVALHSPGTFSGESWRHVFLAPPLATPRADRERCSKLPWKTGLLVLEKVSGGGRAWLASSFPNQRSPVPENPGSWQFCPHIHSLRPRIHVGFSPGLLSLGRN